MKQMNEPKTQLATNSRKSLCVVLLAAAVILFLRRPDAFTNPQFYAEDGTIIFLQHYDIGFRALFLSCSGYLIAIQRLLASLIMTVVPYSLVPLAFNIASVVVTLIIVASVYSPRIPLENKALFALAIVLVPHHSNEVFGNLACSQWIVAIGLVLLLIKKSPQSQFGKVSYQYARDITQLILFGLSGPFLLLFSPLFAWKAWERRDRHSFVILAVAGCCCGLQAFHILSAGLASATGDTQVTFSTMKAIFGTKLFGNLILGAEIPYDLNKTVLAACYVVTMALVVRISSSKGHFVYYFLAVHCAVILGTIIKFRSASEALVPPANGSRYFYLPYLMLVWSLILGINHRDRWKSVFCKIALVVILLSSISTNFRYQPFIDYKWKYYAPRIGKENLEIPINPKGWKMTVNARSKEQ
jgi:hypothetical protein